MSKSKETTKRMYDEMNTVMEAALTKVAERFSADDWDALAHLEQEEES